MSDTADTAGKTPRHRRRGGVRKRAPSLFSQRPFRQPRMLLSPTEAVSADELDAIHEASLTLLEEVGIDFVHAQAKEMLAAAGADVDPDSDRVRMDREFVSEAMETCPSNFTLHARNPARNVHFGGDYMAFSLVASAPNCSDLDAGRRVGNQEDFRKLVKLGQLANIVHVTGGYPVEPVDLHASIRHLDCLSDFVTLTDKVFHIYSLGKERNRDGLQICRIGRGVSDEQFDLEPSLFSVINASSPLRIDTPMLQGIIELSARNQCIVMTPFTLAGAMAPVTLAGALAQQNAEALAGIAFTQVVRPGAPVMYGGFTSNVDMRSGAPAFGTPEYMKAALVGGQLARRYKLPYRSSNVCAANTVDAQAAYESVFSLWGATMGGGNLLMHGAGWLEGGLNCSYEKLVLDLDLLQMVAEFLQPLVVDEDTLALDAVRDVGPGGHFFGTAHTQARYESAFYAPILSDWRNFETWSEAGAPTAYQKANRVWQAMLEQYEPPALDPAIAEELEAYVSQRKEQGGAPTDF